ncbi:hypothetical protein BBMN23_1562 [Bifidobacterium adolescentis]|nr:hypothetical protein BBMN23_1562 [Bifidobacterium adolescentis]
MSMVETAVIKRLNADEGIKAAGLAAYGDVPESRPTRFITVERVGGSSGRIIDRPLIAVQIYASTRSEAMKLAETTRMALMRLTDPTNLTGLAEIAAVDISGVTNYPLDETTPRYQITAQLAVHE